jgi:hypothetical protein
MTGEPTRIIACGDWHGHTAWAENVIRRGPEFFLPGERRIFLHLGDFGIWPGDEPYLAALSAALAETDAELWFIDGNHEQFPKLTLAMEGWDGSGPLEYRERIFYLPRGFRWAWHGRSWLALGGAASVDRRGLVRRWTNQFEPSMVPNRTAGVDWWPEERITREQANAVIAAGPADVMVTHDCPSEVVHAFPDRPRWWSDQDLKESDEHRELLQEVVDAVRPSHLMHGHLHMLYARPVKFSYGTCEVTGLDCNGKDGNWVPLDITKMEWLPELV